MKEISPVAYKMVFMVEGYSGRKETVTVLAKDVLDALSIAEVERCHRGPMQSATATGPRWMDSDATTSPDLLSESVLRHYASKLGFELIRKASDVQTEPKETKGTE